MYTSLLSVGKETIEVSTMTIIMKIFVMNTLYIIGRAKVIKPSPRLPQHVAASATQVWICG